MSDTQPVQPVAAPRGFDNYRSPQVGLAFLLILVGAAVVFGVYVKGSPELFASIAGMVLTATIGAVSGFAFGSSNGSQKKTEALLAPPSPPQKDVA